VVPLYAIQCYFVNQSPAPASFTYTVVSGRLRRKWFVIGAISGIALALAVGLITAGTNATLPLASNAISGPPTAEQNGSADAYDTYMDSVSLAAFALETAGANSSDPAGCKVVGFDARFDNYVIEVWVENRGSEATAYYADYRILAPDETQLSQAWDLFDNVAPTQVGYRQGYSTASPDHRWPEVSCEVYLLTEAHLDS